MRLKEYAKHLNIHYRTAWNHFKKGLIPGAYQLPSGTIIVPEQETESLHKNVAVYCRVSSSQNRTNLKSQSERVEQYCLAKGYTIQKVVQEVGSGINEQRKKFLALLRDQSIDLIVVEHQDRATRFGFHYLQAMLQEQGRNIEVINQVHESKQELMQDLIAIITSFTARYYGQRRAKRKTEKIVQELKEKGNET